VEEGRYDTVLDYKDGDLVEVDACGMGCMLIKKSVFEKLEEPYFQYTPRSKTSLQKGEDYYFCEKAKDAGFKIFCDTSVICGHIGTIVIGPQFWEESRRQLQKLQKEMGEEKFKDFKRNIALKGDNYNSTK